MEDNFHVYPTNDIKQHTIKGIGCDCNPVLERNEHDNGWLVVHRSWDRREDTEEGSITRGRIN